MGSTYNPQDAEFIYRLQRRPDTADSADVARLIEMALSSRRVAVKDPTKHNCVECGVEFFTFGHHHRKTCAATKCRKDLNIKLSREWTKKHRHL